MTAFWLSWKFP